LRERKCDEQQQENFDLHHVNITLVRMSYEFAMVAWLADGCDMPWHFAIRHRESAPALLPRLATRRLNSEHEFEQLKRRALSEAGTVNREKTWKS
jgi:hypothetical protein